MTRELRQALERQYTDRRLAYRESLPWVRARLRSRLRGRLEVARDLVAELCATPGARRVLDFGSGDGELADRIARAVPEGVAEIVGVDLVTSRVAGAEARYGHRGRVDVRFVAGDESSLPAQRGAGFDIVTCTATFCQAVDIYSLARGLHAALAPRGHLVAEFANYAYFRHRLALLAGRIPRVSPAPMDLWPDIGWDSGNHNYTNYSMAVQFLRQTGFHVVRMRPTGLVANLMPILPSLFATGFVFVARRDG